MAIKAPVRSVEGRECPALNVVAFAAELRVQKPGKRGELAPLVAHEERPLVADVERPRRRGAHLAKLRVEPI
jgi:hypothetical protein